jgi:riboflavin kinase/FMN adenylyltransferase
VIEARRAGTLHRGVANLGYRPTVSGEKPERLLELHLFDLDRDIYGEELEVRFLRYLRPEQRFENIEALKTQIARDVEQARESFSVRD